jgi:hypothetical protein
MGVEYNQLGEVCEFIKQAKWRKFVWVVTIVLDSDCFHEQQAMSRIEEIGAGETMEGGLWIMLECF